MMRCLYALIVVFFLALPGVASATATAAVAAALKDEAAECRYVLQLCNEQGVLLADLEESRKELAALQHHGIDSENYQQAQPALAKSKMNRDFVMNKYRELTEAVKVVKIKHAQMPECFKQCTAVNLQNVR